MDARRLKEKDKSEGDNQLQVGEQASLETHFEGQNSLSVFNGDRKTGRQQWQTTLSLASLHDSFTTRETAS